MKPFDLTTVYNAERPMSWSAINAFEWQPSGWHAKYVVHGRCKRPSDDGSMPGLCVLVGTYDPECPVIKTSPELRFGSWVDKKIQNDKNFLPELVRYPVFQHEMRVTFAGIPLVGYSDAFLPLKKPVKKYLLRDYKTGRKPWDQKRADETGQLTMYAFMLWLELKIQPEQGEFFIDWLPTHVEDGEIAFIKEGEIITFATKRSMQQVLEFGQRIQSTWKKMEEYAARQVRVPIERPVSKFLS